MAQVSGTEYYVANWVGLMTLGFGAVVTYLVSVDKYQRVASGGHDPENGDIHFSLVATSERGRSGQLETDKQLLLTPSSSSKKHSSCYYSSTAAVETFVELNGSGEVFEVKGAT